MQWYWSHNSLTCYSSRELDGGQHRASSTKGGRRLGFLWAPMRLMGADARSHTKKSSPGCERYCNHAIQLFLCPPFEPTRTNRKLILHLLPVWMPQWIENATPNRRRSFWRQHTDVVFSVTPLSDDKHTASNFYDLVLHFWNANLSDHRMSI